MTENRGATDNEIEEQDRSYSRGRITLQIIGIVLIVLAFLLAIYGTVGYVAWERGQTAREETAREVQLQELEEQITLAKEDVTADNLELALRRVEWIIDQDPDFPGAAALQQQIQASLDVRLTPTATATPKPTLTPSATPAGPDPLPVFNEIEELISEESWDDALTALNDFRSQFPDFRRNETDAMLYDAYVNLGLSLLSGEQVELGLFYLTQAEKLGNLPQEAEDQRLWAELYLVGIGYFGVDWGSTVFYFRDLCAAAPFYQDSCAKFYTALVAYGDQYVARLDWCPAENIYSEARQIDSDGTLIEKLQEARTGCEEATPTPTATLEGESLITATPEAVE